MKRILLIIWLFLVSVSVFAQNPDINLLRKLNVTQPVPAAQHFWMGMTKSVYFVPAVYAVSNLTYGLAAHDNSAMRYSLETTLSAGISMAISGALKAIVKRPRPTDAYPDDIQSYSYTRTYSFPSGHSAASFATATTMSFQANRWYASVPIFTWSFGVGYSRMRLGKHYPSDVLSGILIGIGSGLLSHWITEEMVH